MKDWKREGGKASESVSSFSFDLISDCPETSARVGIVHTAHGDVPTPVFAPVGTQATVKSLSPDELEQLDASLILANAYHLYLRPGAETVAKLGGLHGFMGWDGPILTDSGGFQVFSLEHLRKVDDDGVTFRSHIDGSEHRFTPESVVDIQEKLGADIIMVFDECAPPSDYEYNVKALNRTHRWAERCIAAKRRDDQALFGIVQGGVFDDLRRESVEFLSALNFPGYAIGGLSVGEHKRQMLSALDVVCPMLPSDKPRYLMGVGSPEDLFECVARGVDMFDCVLPTRIARNGALFTRTGRLNIRNARFADDLAPIEEDCECYTCRKFSRAYLRHLVKANELFGLRLTAIHNLHFLLNLMRRIRESIQKGAFASLKDDFLSSYRVTDHEVRIRNKQARLRRLRSQSERRG